MPDIMEASQLIQAKLEKKFVLLDTNILIGASTNYSAYQPLFELLEETECAPAHFSFIEFEFVRGAYESENMKKRRMFFQQIQSFPMGVPADEIITSAIAIANVYAGKNHNTASFIDCCVAAFLKRHSASLFLLTEDHKDFPLFLFDRIHVMPIDTGKDIHTPAFYEYNDDKASKLLLF